LERGDLLRLELGAGRHFYFAVVLDSGEEALRSRAFAEAIGGEQIEAAELEFGSVALLTFGGEQWANAGLEELVGGGLARGGQGGEQEEREPPHREHFDIISLQQGTAEAS